MATTRFIDHLLEGDHASRPAAGDVPEGTLYSCTTHSLVYQSDTSTWTTWATLGGGTPDLDAVIAASSGQDIADALSGAAAPDAGNVFATMADVGGGGGAYVLLEQHSASSSATLDFTTFISSSYDTYRFDFVELVNATNTVDLWMRMGTGAGPTWDAGGNYEYNNGFFSGGGAGFAGAAAQSQILLTTAASGVHVSNATAAIPVHGRMELWLPSSTSFYKMTQGEFNFKETSAGVRVYTFVRGEYASTTAVTGVRFMFSSGNITSGTIRCYGLVNA